MIKLSNFKAERQILNGKCWQVFAREPKGTDDPRIYHKAPNELNLVFALDQYKALREAKKVTLQFLIRPDGGRQDVGVAHALLLVPVPEQPALYVGSGGYNEQTSIYVNAHDDEFKPGEIVEFEVDLTAVC